MRILIVASYNRQCFAPFVLEQAWSLAAQGCVIDFFGITGTGISGYASALPSLRKKIGQWHPDIIHAHYGLSGLLANMQRRVPVVTTYHGSDINEKSVLPFSKLCMKLSRFNVFVSQKTLDIARPGSRYGLIPCGVDLCGLQLTDRLDARKALGLDPDKRYVLFAGAFDNPVKNYPLARAAMDLVPEAELVELKGRSREQVTLLMCAVDTLLMTSFTEGSPQVVKEAMACGCPIVSVDVGDVKENLGNLPFSFVTSRSCSDIADCILRTFSFVGKTPGRGRIVELGLDNASVSGKLIRVYSEIQDS